MLNQEGPELRGTTYTPEQNLYPRSSTLKTLASGVSCLGLGQERRASLVKQGSCELHSHPLGRPSWGGTRPPGMGLCWRLQSEAQARAVLAGSVSH